MCSPAYEERNGTLYIRCHYCKSFIAQQKLGQHLRDHRSAGEPFSTAASPHRKQLIPRQTSNRQVQRRHCIKEICERRHIQKVVHFTRSENLARILREGLLPRATLERKARKGRRFIAVDSARYDGHKHTVSVSISFPNYQMFYKVRQQTSDEKWVVLGLDHALLWRLDCAFCEENAASAEVRHRPLPSLKRVEALQAMFADTVFQGKRTIRRSDLSIPDFYPTNPQAEVLVCEPIKPDYVCEVSFLNWNQHRQWTEINGDDWNGVELNTKPGLFRSRPGNWDKLAKE